MKTSFIAIRKAYEVVTFDVAPDAVPVYILDAAKEVLVVDPQPDDDAEDIANVETALLSARMFYGIDMPVDMQLAPDDVIAPSGGPDEVGGVVELSDVMVGVGHPTASITAMLQIATNLRPASDRIAEHRRMRALGLNV